MRSLTTQYGETVEITTALLGRKVQYIGELGSPVDSVILAVDTEANDWNIAVATGEEDEEGDTIGMVLTRSCFKYLDEAANRTDFLWVFNAQIVCIA